MEYIDLHIHTEFTKGNGITRIPYLIKKAKEYGMRSLTITDSGSIEGFHLFNSECRKEGIKPIFGCGFYFAPLGLDKPETHHLVLIAKNNLGLNNLKELNDFSCNKGLGNRPRIDREVLKRFHSNLFCLTGGLGGVYDKPYLMGNINLADSNLEFLKDLFKDNLYLEIQDNEIEKNRIMLKQLVNLSKIENIPLVVTGGSFYLNREDCTGCNSVRRKMGNRELVGSGYFFRSPMDIKEIFCEYEEAINNSNIIGNSCNVEILF